MYSVLTTEIFDRWFKRLKDSKGKSRIQARIDRIELEGYFGDSKLIEYPVYELRFFFGAGYRIYYMQQGDMVVILLVGGDKSSQDKDINTAKQLADDIIQGYSDEQN